MRYWGEDLEALRPQFREETATFLASVPSRGVDTSSLPLAERVAFFREAEFSSPPSAKAVDRTIDGPAGPLRLRTFPCEDAQAVLFHIHGGGWMAGAPESVDLLNEVLVDMLNIAVVSVDYRLAPEHPYPAAPDDCEAAACWLLEQAKDEFGADRFLIGGESAGAHLAAVTLLRMKNKHNAVDRFIGANLVFGAYDLSRTPSQRGIGIQSENDILDGTEFPLDCLLPGLSAEQRRDPDISPLYGDLSGMPPALFSVGTNDHLLDDTLFMAARWEMAGNRTTLLVYPDTPHANIALPSVAGHFFPRLFEFLRECLTAPVPASQP